MTKPPATPPNSDLEGVHRDRTRIDRPQNATSDPGESLREEEAGNKAKPEDSRS